MCQELLDLLNNILRANHSSLEYAVLEYKEQFSQNINIINILEDLAFCIEEIDNEKLDYAISSLSAEHISFDATEG